ncbi:hypothetical protein EMPG_15595 [Blastomyces silverae]|uniref:Uncharacterized protein n=1 Tax=Blastomyces silverae TaxID=2060906 RepID=A0A0H1BIH2_9EURO|nr:hypothetical protein EMPG_15595 [Blastomyces silverae]
MEDQSIDTMLKEFAGNYSIFEMGYAMGEEDGVGTNSLPITIDDGDLLHGSNGGVERKVDDGVIVGGGGSEQIVRLSV